MNSRTTHRLITLGLFLALVAAPAFATAASTDAESEGPAADRKSLAGSFVVFEPGAAGAACWAPSVVQTLCFRTESFTDDFEYVESLWLSLPSAWGVIDVTVSGSPSCDVGSFGSFSWSYDTPPYEVRIDHQRTMYLADHCTAVYCVDVATAPGSGDEHVSWYWAGDTYGSPPHNPCSDDGYTPSGQAACDESVLPRAAIPDCSAFGQLEGTIRDVFTAGPTCTPARAAIAPDGITAPADGSGSYGPVFLADGSYDVTASADGFDDATATSVSLVAGTITTQDFDLVRPVMDVSPPSFDTTVPLSSTADETLTLDNIGYIPPLDWSIAELPPVESASPLSQPAEASPIRVEPELAAEMQSRG
ncbi:MAG: carboxypeptidase-like regulatory domain-containing protein, partial [Candidatus Sulfomarinibacteraceae bacterium]